MRKRTTTDPTTPEEWQDAVNAAAGWRAIADCKMYGLLQGGPEINVRRCDEILDRGARKGITPSKPAADLAIDLIRRLNA